MMALWLAIGAVALIVAVALAWPLLRADAAAPRRMEYDIRVFKDQLVEVDNDRRRGLLSDREADAARTEIERRMLTAVENEEATPDRAPPGGRLAAVAVALAVPLAGLGMYLALGQPQAPNVPYAERDLDTAPRTAETGAGADGDEIAPEMAAAIAGLAARLEQNPDDLRGWTLLARSYEAAHDFGGAARAWRRAMEVSGGRPDLAANFAEAAILANDGHIPPDIAGLIERIVEIDPINLKARYFRGLAQAQQGRVRDALQTWVDLKAMSPAGASWLPLVEQQIARAAAQTETDVAAVEPTAAAKDLAARVAAQAAAPAGAGVGAPALSAEQRQAVQQMAPEEREEMIRGMVQRLADRLQQQPDDLQGWQRLARAYEVLGDAEKAAEARARAEELQRRQQ